MKNLFCRIHFPLKPYILNFTGAMWRLWLPLALASLWIRMVTTYNILYCEKFLIYPFLRGFASDLVTLSAVAFLATFIVRKWYWQFLIAIFYCGLLTINSEFIMENDSNLDFSMIEQAMSGGFVQNSINQVLIAKFLQLLGIFGMAYITIRKYRPNPHFAHYVFPLLIVLIVAYCHTTSFNKNRSVWKQANLAEDYLRNVIRTKKFDTNIETAAAKRFFSKDLSGKKIIRYPARPGTNVLMIVMESVGMDHVKRGWLPYLKSLSKESISYKHFYTASANTINGEYSMLCGDAPGLAIGRAGAVKAWGLVNRKSPPLYCLPKLLASAGYKTVYMQPANLKFQKKDRFLPMIGFDEYYGRNELPTNKNRKDWPEWGPDDAEFYDIAFKRIMRLKKEKKPWLMNLMTISTHYPANVPDSFVVKGEKNPNSRKRSSLYADNVLKEFMARLEENGVLDNTVVVITNDEVRTGGNGKLPGLLNKNHGIMYVITPHGERRKISEPFGQTDFFLSMADYLGFPTEKIQIGRSMFRKYKSFYPMFFGNYFHRAFVAMPNKKHVLICSTATIDCHQLNMNKGRDIFSKDYTEARRLRKGYASMMRQLVTMNARSKPRLWNEEEDAVELPRRKKRTRK